MHGVNSAESAGGRLGAVLNAPRTGMIELGRFGPWVAATPELARRVLTEPTVFDFPTNVSRTADLTGSRGDSRSGHNLFSPLSGSEVELGRNTFAGEWADVVRVHDETSPNEPYDAMLSLRQPVARSTTAAAMPSVQQAERDAIADAVLAWVDALGPVISARRPPHRWGRRRRSEVSARHALEQLLQEVEATDQPGQLATFLAAGVQVPIAAGAWLLAHLANHHTGPVDPIDAVWETLRLTPPTWITARIAVQDVKLADTMVTSGSVVMVSPLLLGRSPALVPGDADRLDAFDPRRWRDQTRRPGAWLPFGAGPHACPGRNLGMAQLVELASWAVSRELRLSETVSVDQSRGIAPRPCRVHARPLGEPS